MAPVEKSSHALPLNRRILANPDLAIVALAVFGIVAHFGLSLGWTGSPFVAQLPLVAVLLAGGLPLLVELSKRLLQREFGSDLLGGIAILTSVMVGDYLVGTVIVLMLAGGAALEEHARRSASSVLDALARRMPSVAHRKESDEMRDVALAEIQVGDILVSI